MTATPSNMPPKVRIVEVGPRDGLQNEKTPVPSAAKVAFNDMLGEAGLTLIEATAAVSQKWVPQLGDMDVVYPAIRKRPGVVYSILVPNAQGMQRALDVGAQEVAIFTAASETFSRKNANCSIDESFGHFAPVMEMARDNNLRVRGYVSCVLGCPYEGDVDVKTVARVAKRLIDIGCYEVSLGDTIGRGTPETTRAMLQEVKKLVPVEKLAVHLHDTGGRACDNAKAALEEGIAVMDASASGLGGCPYAPGASGNVATEKLLDMLHGLGIETGVDRDKVAAAGRFIRNILRPQPPKNGGPACG